MIDEGMLSNNLVVHWGSGEPTIFPDFNELFKLLCEFGAIHTLSSNSTVFSQTLYDYLNNVKNITTSIDAGYPATYKAIRGRDMLHNVLKNLSVYANKKPDALTIQYVICKPGDKKEEIDQFIKNITSYSLNLCNFSITSDVEQPLTNQYLRSCRYLVQKLSEIIDPDKINISRHIIQRIGSFNGHYDIIAQNKAFKLIINRHNLRKNISSRLDSAVREFKRKSRRKINKRLNKLDNKVL
jgi:MoaA/NifB/PqqE/SkfB family radical SAM enzyme